MAKSNISLFIIFNTFRVSSELWALITQHTNAKGPSSGATYPNRRETSVFWSWLLTKTWLFIRPQAHIRLTCCKQGWVVRKVVNANPGLKVNIIYKSFSLLLFCVFLDYSPLKTEGQTIHRKPHRKVRKLESKFLLNLGFLWRTRPRSSAFRLG